MSFPTDLTELNMKIEEIETHDNEVGAIAIISNGNIGGWDVAVQFVDWNLDAFTKAYHMDNLGRITEV